MAPRPRSLPYLLWLVLLHTSSSSKHISSSLSQISHSSWRRTVRERGCNQCWRRLRPTMRWRAWSPQDGEDGATLLRSSEENRCRSFCYMLQPAFEFATNGITYCSHRRHVLLQCISGSRFCYNQCRILLQLFSFFATYTVEAFSVHG